MCRLCYIDLLYMTSLIICINPAAILEGRAVQTEYEYAHKMVNFCAFVGCGNRSDREKEIGFIIYQQ